MERDKINSPQGAQRQDDLVKRAREALDGVTTGPWQWHEHTAEGIIRVIEPYMCQGEGLVEISDADARFIAASRDLIPAMADRIEQLVATNEALTAERDAAQARADALAEKIADIVDAWEWWQVDPYDRCQSVPQDAVDAARATLAQITGETDG